MILLKRFILIPSQFPLRIVCIGEDATVRIISGKTGNIITTSLVPYLTTITDAVYSAGEGRTISILSNSNSVLAIVLKREDNLLMEDFFV